MLSAIREKNEGESNSFYTRLNQLETLDRNKEEEEEIKGLFDDKIYTNNSFACDGCQRIGGRGEYREIAQHSSDPSR